jgi:Flp pilus assembly protein TadB
MTDSNQGQIPRGRYPRMQQGGNRSMQSMLRFRWALTALSLVLAVVLLARGAVLIGGIIGVMAVTRTVMLLQWQRRSRERRERFAGRSTEVLD